VNNTLRISHRLAIQVAPSPEVDDERIIEFVVVVVVVVPETNIVLYWSQVVLISNFNYFWLGPTVHAVNCCVSGCILFGIVYA
jgi:hypothetical protein